MEQTENIQTPISPVNNVQNQHFSTKKLMIGIGLILVLATIFVLGMGYESKSNRVYITEKKPVKTVETVTNDIDGWKTLRSQFNDISFKYPADYSLEDRANYIAIMSPVDRSKGKTGRPLDLSELKMEVIIFDSIQNDNLSTWVEELQNTTSGTISELGLTTINGVEAKVLVGVGTGTSKMYLVVNNGKRYMIVKYPLSTSRDGDFDQILSTFKFNDSATNEKSKVYGTFDIGTYDENSYSLNWSIIPVVDNLDFPDNPDTSRNMKEPVSLIKVDANGKVYVVNKNVFDYMVGRFALPCTEDLSSYFPEQQELYAEECKKLKSSEVLITKSSGWTSAREEYVVNLDTGVADIQR